MPEGDVVWRTADRLHRALAGRELVTSDLRWPSLATVDLTGRTVTEVVARGKHMLTRLADGRTLRTHYRMDGSWHIYRPGERWQRSARDMRIVVATGDFVAVGFNVPVAEFLTARTLARQPDLRQLGPDLLGTGFDPAEAARRIRERANTLAFNFVGDGVRSALDPRQRHARGQDMA